MGSIKGQITIFIIISLFVVGAVFLFFAMQKGLIQQPLSPDSERIHNFIQNCVEQEGIKTIYQIGKNGGYFFPPNLSTSSGVAIYYSNNKSYVPTKEQIQNEISFYMNYQLFFCARNFIDFPDLNITPGEINTQTEMEKDKVILNINYPITISKGESKSTIQNFKAGIPVRMGIVYDSVSEFMQNQTNGGICISCMLNIAEKNDLYVDMMDYDPNTTLLLFRDKNSKINNNDFVWIFANRYGANNG